MTCFVSDINVSRNSQLTQQHIFTGQQVDCTHIYTSPTTLRIPPSHHQSCSWKPAVLSLSSWTPSTMDHKDLILQSSFPKLISATQSPTQADIPWEHSCWTSQKMHYHTHYYQTLQKTQKGNKNQGTEYPSNKEKSWNKHLDLVHPLHGCWDATLKHDCQ